MRALFRGHSRTHHHEERSVIDKRPVNLSIPTIHLPVTATVSILHRVSGVILIGGFAVFLYLLHFSLASPSDFAKAAHLMTLFPCKLVIWGLLAALIYHICAEIRHLLMDMGIGESLKGGTLGAQLVLRASAVLIIVSFFWVMSW